MKIKLIMILICVLGTLTLVGCGQEYTEGGCQNGGGILLFQEPTEVKCIRCEKACNNIDGQFLGYEYRKEYGGAFQEHGFEPAACLCRLNGSTENIYKYDRDVNKNDFYGEKKG